MTGYMTEAVNGGFWLLRGHERVLWLPGADTATAARLAARYQAEADAPRRPRLAPDEHLESRLMALAAYRWRCETAGITVDGIAIATDRDSQFQVAEVARVLAAGLESVIKFKTRAGVIVDLDATVAGRLYRAVVRYVQACRTTEAKHGEVLRALPADRMAIYDFRQGWPDRDVRDG